MKRFLIGDAETANCITEWFDSIDEAVDFMMNEEEDPDLMAIYYDEKGDCTATNFTAECIWDGRINTKKELQELRTRFA